jgi:hypothetical protein
MEYFSVSSSALSAVGYDDTSNTLGVRFVDGREYNYYGVPKEIFEGLRSAPSVGTYFDQYVKKAGYSFTQTG